MDGRMCYRGLECRRCYHDELDALDRNDLIQRSKVLNESICKHLAMTMIEIIADIMVAREIILWYRINQCSSLFLFLCLCFLLEL